MMFVDYPAYLDQDGAARCVAVSTPTGPTVLLLCGPAFSGAGV